MKTMSISDLLKRMMQGQQHRRCDMLGGKTNTETKTENLVRSTETETKTKTETESETKNLVR